MPTATSCAFFAVNSKAAFRVPVVSMRMPSRVDWATILATSSTVNELFTSFLGSIRSSRSTPFAVALSPTMIGRKIVATSTSGGASSSTDRSGSENDRFFGTISPKMTWRNETSSSAVTNATTETTPSPRPSACRGTSMRWWIDGSDTFRINREHTVMPSWLVASIRVACSIAHRAVFAGREPRSALGSICDRRAEITANSAPTKNAFTVSRRTSQTIPHHSFIAVHRPST